MALSCGSRVLINTGECSKSISNAAVRALESDEISASGGIMIDQRKISGPVSPNLPS